MTKQTSKGRDDAASATLLPESEPPEKLSSLVGEYPGLAIAAGIGLGVLAGALLPRRAGRKLARGAFFLASTGSELGLILGKQALDKVDEATRERREMLGETAAELTHKAADAGQKAGILAKQVAGDASGRARNLGQGLAKLAIDTASRLRH